jgi:hypothetical protein|mmetsp:Transcript_99916/g.158117  ORF Transcript_99916/g.158117 Transcript_99916/m.158117 type:complete len:96 (-) Transcript_99916:827-1114(-)
MDAGEMEPILLLVTRFVYRTDADSRSIDQTRFATTPPSVLAFGENVVHVATLLGRPIVQDDRPMWQVLRERKMCIANQVAEELQSEGRQHQRNCY